MKRKTLSQNTFAENAQPKAATVNKAAASTSNLVLLNLSAIIPVNGRATSDDVATSPATNPPVAREAPSKTTYPVMMGFSI